MVDLTGKTIVITGSARRLGRQFALAAAKAGGNVVIHHSNSPDEAQKTADEARAFGVSVKIIQADFSDSESALEGFKTLFDEDKHLFALINNAAIFKSLKWNNTSITEWERHMNINLTMPFFLSQSFARSLDERPGKIINILDWRAFRPGYGHFPYTISKAGLASVTKSLALSLAPNIQVNGLALGAILPPSDGADESDIIIKVPAGRWAKMDELIEIFLFLLSGPEYITGEIIHVDGGRHLV